MFLTGERGCVELVGSAGFRPASADLQDGRIPSNADLRLRLRFEIIEGTGWRKAFLARI